MEKLKKKTSKKALVVAVVSAVAAVGAIATLVIILLGGRITIDSPQDDPGGTSLNRPVTRDQIADLDNAVKDLPNQTALDFIFSRLDGYWTSNNLFVNFIASNGVPTIQYGLYETSYGETGEIKGVEVTGTNAFCLTVLIAATPANEMDGARPERTETICIDVSNVAKESRLNIKISNSSIGDKQWHTYEFGGSSLEGAYKDGVVEE